MSGIALLLRRALRGSEADQGRQGFAPRRGEYRDMT